MARIAALDAEPLDLALRAPFVVATGRKDLARNVLVRLRLEDGTSGYGEVSPSPYSTGDTRDSALAVLGALGPLVVGRDVRAWRAILSDTRRAVRGQVAAHSGLELALLDAFGKHAGVPLWQLFGGAQRTVEIDFTLSLGSVAEIERAAVQAVGEGFRKLKIKVGQGLAADCEWVAAVGRVAPGCEILLDANQAYTPKGAVALVRRLEQAGTAISLLEQPVPRDDLAGMRFVREHAPVPVGADESVFTAEDALRVIRAEAADMINIKVAKSGLLGALDIAAIARSANLGLMIGCMMESKLGLAGSVHLACGLGCFDHCDLDSVYLLEPFDCEGGFDLAGPVLSVEGIAAGTGLRYLPSGERPA